MTTPDQRQFMVTQSPLKMINAFLFALKAISVLKAVFHSAKKSEQTENSAKIFISTCAV